MKLFRTIVPWALLLAACLAWIGVALFVAHIHALEGSYASRVSATGLAAARESSAVQVRALARDTKDLRKELQRLASRDVLAAADTIESAGALSGTQIKIDAVLPGANGSDVAGADENIVTFAVSSEGSLNMLMRTAALLETLPLLARLQRAEFQRAETAAGQQWRFTANIQVLAQTRE